MTKLLQLVLVRIGSLLSSDELRTSQEGGKQSAPPLSSEEAGALPPSGLFLLNCPLKLIHYLLVIFLWVTPALAQRYQNPVISGDHPDPSVIRVGGEYWATTTSGTWEPEFSLFRSRDLLRWEISGAVFQKRPAWAERDFWAPEISTHNGRFFVYYTARKKGGPLCVAVATAATVAGPYIDHGPLVCQKLGSIDAMAVTDENGVRYLVWKEDGNSRDQPTPMWAQKLSDDGLKLRGRKVELIRNDPRSWEGGVVEGAFILRRGNWFYLFYSGNACCGRRCNYALGVARSSSVLEIGRASCRERV